MNEYMVWWLIIPLAAPWLFLGVDVLLGFVLDVLGALVKALREGIGI